MNYIIFIGILYAINFTLGGAVYGSGESLSIGLGFFVFTWSIARISDPKPSTLYCGVRYINVDPPIVGDHRILTKWIVLLGLPILPVKSFRVPATHYYPSWLSNTTQYEPDNRMSLEGLGVYGPGIAAGYLYGAFLIALMAGAILAIAVVSSILDL